MNPLRVALTTGDPNGIGPEVVLKCLADGVLDERIRPVLVGSVAVLEAHARRIGLPLPRLQPTTAPRDVTEPGVVPVVESLEGPVEGVQFGLVQESAGRFAMAAVKRAVTLCTEGLCDAMVTAPISKEAVALAGYGYPGHTEFIAELTGGEPLMLMVAESLRVGLVTGHVPLREVPGAISVDAVRARLQLLAVALRSDFGIGHPRIAVLGLNPHAGDGGVLGSEERAVLRPALEASRRSGIQAFGPFPADGFFAAGTHHRYDAVLAMYHDQGLAPFKALSFGRGVNCTVGLPVVRTSPDHGTAFDIAGAGTASPDSFRAAIDLALEIAHRRRGSA